MTYISKEQIQEKRKQINALCKSHGVSATVSCANSSSVTVTIRKGKIDFFGNHVDTVKSVPYADDTAEGISTVRKQVSFMECNHHCLDRQFSNDALVFLEQVLAILKIGYSDNSDSVTDYSDCAWHIHICIGQWNKPYLLISE